MEIGARSVTVHSNGLGEGGRVLCPYDDLSDAVKLCTMFDTLKIAAEWAENCGVRINLEPLNVTTDHPGNFLRHTRTAAELTRLIGSPYLKVLYDVYHMQLNEGSLCDHIRAYADQFGHIHVADAPGRHEPGTGEIHYSAVFAALEQAGYRGLDRLRAVPQNRHENRRPGHHGGLTDYYRKTSRKSFREVFCGKERPFSPKQMVRMQGNRCCASVCFSMTENVAKSLTSFVYFL